MKKFEQFSISKQELIFGGDLIFCDYIGRDGEIHRDIYDTDTDTVYYVEP